MIECYTTDAHEPMRRTELAFSRNKRAEMNLVKVYPHKTFQRVAGFGAALTESAAYTFALMPPEVQDRFLGLCFGPGGQCVHAMQDAYPELRLLAGQLRVPYR